VNQTIRIGTRGSQLALWQANHVADLLRANGHAVELEVIRTVGDRMQSKDFVAPQGLSPNGTGIFIKEIEDALLAGRIDLAVHSLKDLPTQITPGLTLAAIPPRADARDAFVCEEHWGLHMLPSGSRVATTSPRRQAMVLALRPDLTFVEMRGNIDTRLRKWSEGEADALILASAGLDRLGRTESVHQRFAVDELTPAPGQGALALQVRCPTPPQHCHSEPPPYCHPEPKAKDLLLASDDNALNGVDALKGTGFSPSVEGTKEDRALAPEGKGVRDATIHAIIRTLNCPTTEYATQAERAVLHALGGGCQLPLGAYCHRVTTSTNGIEADHWHLHAMIVSPDGEQVVQVLHKAPLSTPATDLGQSVAEALKARGALELLNPEPVISTEA
jgi:hydroxymethylbilane synthase